MYVCMYVCVCDACLTSCLCSRYMTCPLGQEFFAVEVAANALVSSNEACMRLIRQAARALYNDSYPNGMTHLCRLPTQIPMKWWPRETLRAGEVVHILGEFGSC